MKHKPIQSIDDVITCLNDIILTSGNDNNPLGYFAALYRKVTIKVKEGIKKGVFDDGPRMEKLDVVFAKRYIDAYYAYQNQQAATESWEKTFLLSKKNSAIVFQHLLMGMNAHINLDLGLAAAEISKGHDIADLKNDFNKINSILSSLVKEVEQDLSRIWPTLKKILKKTKLFDALLVDFSMEMARDGAWKFAEFMAHTEEDHWRIYIIARDQKIAKKGETITSPGFLIKVLLWVIWVEEIGSVKTKIKDLSGT